MSADETSPDPVEPGEDAPGSDPEPNEDEAEAEEEGEQNATASAEDASPEPSGELTEEQLAKLQKEAVKRDEQIMDKLDREAGRHRTRLAEILQEDVLRLVPCELCRADLSGWIDSTQPIPEDVKQRVRIMIGDREPVVRQHDRYSRRCDDCGGEGTVETGSKVNGQTDLPCLDCGAKGWVAVGPERQGLGVPPLRPVMASPEAAAASPNGPEPPEAAALREQGYVVIKTARPV